MEATRRERMLWVVALVAALIGTVLFYSGAGRGRSDEIGWFDYLREMFALVGSVPVEPAGIAGLLLVGSGTMTAAFLLSRRWSTPSSDPTARAQRAQPHTRVWWIVAAAVAVIGAFTVVISMSAPQPHFVYGTVNGPGAVPPSPSVIEDPMLLFDTIYVAPATFVGAGLLWTGLLVMSVLLGRRATHRAPVTAAPRRRADPPHPTSTSG